MLSVYRFYTYIRHTYTIKHKDLLWLISEASIAYYKLRLTYAVSMCLFFYPMSPMHPPT